MPVSVFDAIKAKSLSQLLEAVKDKSIIDTGDDFGQTPLMCVLQSWGEIEAVRHLIDAGADVQAKDNEGDTALHYAARFTSNPKIVKLLTESGADINAQEHDSAPTPLLAALEFKNGYSMIKEIIRAGANVNCCVRDILDAEWTPLMVACVKTKDPEVVSLIIESGARFDVFDEDGNTPYSLAIKNAALEGSAVLEKLKLSSPSKAQARAYKYIKEAFVKSSKKRLLTARTLSILIASESVDYLTEQLISFSQVYGYKYIGLSIDLFKESKTETIANLQKLKDVYKVLFIDGKSIEEINMYLSPFDSLLLNGSFGVISNAPETTFTNDPIIVVGIQSEDFNINQLDYHMMDRFWRVVG